ncbi:MAG: ATP-binding cassette domain-containing protein [Planctomycetes bacterium]|nr:ATP-binding cassette domain-containing protein [Planctomycetota bacterium]
MSFAVRKGEVLVIIGYSGSGKSVTLQTMVGLLTPQSGSIKVGGQQIVGMKERELADVRRRFGYLFQSGALINWMTVGENVELPLREHTALNLAARKSKVQEKLELVSMLNAAAKYPGEISGGMKKRAALARAIALDPEIVLFDEPTSGLDPVIAYQIDKLICDINKKLGITCIVVSHDMESVYTIADRVAFFHEGRMYFIGTPEELRNSKDPEVQRFVTGGRAEAMATGGGKV